MTLTVIIDADILAYQVASNTEVAIEWEDDLWTTHGDMAEARSKVEEALDHILQKTGASDFALCLTDSAGNFRKAVYPDYKGNRKNTRAPFLLKPIKEWMLESLDAYWRPALEGDDVIGILATAPSIIKGDRLIYSADKDLRQIPGMHWDGDSIIEITEEEGDAFFFEQVLTGDPTDGYPGCPGMGKVKALEVLANPRMLIRTEQEITKGKDAGTTRVVWKQGDPCDVWTAIVYQYEKAGLNEEDAYVQAHCARILRHGEYNYKKKEPILWTA